MVWPFNTKAQPDRRPNEAPKQPNVFYLRSGVGVAIVDYGEAISAKKALKHPIVFRAVDKIASSVEQVNWYAEVDEDASATDRKNVKTTVNDLNALLKDPHPDMTPSQMRYWLGLNYAVYARAPLKIGFSATDPQRPNGLYPLEADAVSVKLSKRGIPSEFAYGKNNQNAEKYPSQHEVRRGDGRAFVGQVWKPGLRGYQNKEERMSPLAAIGLPAEVITQLLIRAARTAAGHPNVRYLVTAEKTLTEKQVRTLRDHLNDDFDTEGEFSGSIPILRNVGKVEIHKLDNDLSDIHSKMPSDDMARLIFGAFGIPIALAGMGAADGAKFAGNYIESRNAFWQDTVIPMYVTPLFQGLSRMLCPPGARIVPDLETIPAMLSGRVAVGKDLKDIDFLTREEKRVTMGWPRTPEDGMGTLPPLTAPNGQENNNDNPPSDEE